ncbi:MULTISPECIES: pantoate--beta-alanine ligase [Frankia]|uniref:Pantothenate synthetase 3 n=1 Tax=Frankia alni (strain DSM 45986 / CECT 9034 / ACN14a) TaxID=326424 RepID=PANC3_FRAAA|nr:MULTISPECIES: pantoate--beta-alanine ligase [Frankia]Q0RC35.1 RecName: Full=Pantothenate synthetase 3; Short=PS 3; AltName: Full=Pantoate--beta-alanine ligase 3; AltName: Full=Pantoate-activating enzyme 3 [Frankia alni ACN14a]CAJ64994.1 Pantoate-beta-alanine ligase (Pantothenate synthetase) (Pantoate activating enzyme) [Frankia alni ACN14a]
MLRVLHTIEDVREQTREWRAAGSSIGCVMTMGALHEGHLSLVDAARRECDKVVLTLFVNPIQFGPSEDFDRYPRTEEADFRALRDRECDAVFAPATETIFPLGERRIDQVRTKVVVRGLTDVLCGPRRPGHFDGVTTEVLKMLHIVDCDRTYWGEKDYQQYAVIRAMVEDQGLPVKVVPCPTMRDVDGLALSSRNTYLDSGQRAIAPRLYAALRRGARRIAEQGIDVIGETTKQIAETLLAHGFDLVEYVEVYTGSLGPAVAGTPVEELRVFGAVRLGGARLLDNAAVADEVGG